MELEELKEIWQRQPDYEAKPETEIALMLKSTSNSIVSKLKRNVWFELIFTIACSIALTVYTITLNQGALLWMAVSLLLLFTAYLFYYVKKLMLLQRFDASDANMKNNLTNLYQKLSAYVTFYKRSYGILYPVYFFLGIFFGAIETGMDNFLNRLKDPLVITYLIALTGIFFVITIFITNVYLKKLYGNHLDRLKQLLNDLQG